jgi:tRNA(fMet)-specific endonuclease VapC
VSACLLDTNTVISFFKGAPTVVERWASVPPASMHISSISLYELIVGATTSSKPEKRRSDLELVLRYIRVLPFAEEEAEQAARARAALQAGGSMIGPLDLIIASTALAHDLTLVTHNLKEFRRVPKLRCDDWC